MENKNKLFNKKLIGEWLTQAIIEHSTRTYDKKLIRNGKLEDGFLTFSN